MTFIILFWLQIFRVESANDVYIRFPGLDGLQGGGGSTEEYECPVWNYTGPTGFYFPYVLTQMDVIIIFFIYFNRNIFFYGIYIFDYDLQAGHFVFLDNAKGFHSSVLHACRRFLSPDMANYPLEEGVISV